MKILSLILLLAALSGCQTLPSGKPDTSEEVTEKAPVALPFAEPEKPEQDLDAELVFDYLVGEIGTRQGDFATALQFYREAAEAARDPYAAERATQLALHLKDLDSARDAAALWSELAPNSQDARKFFAVLLLRKGYEDEALSELWAMRQIGDALGKDGLLQVTMVLAGEPDHEAARRVFDRLVADDPEAPQALYASALLDTAQRQLERAEATLRRGLSVKPAWPEARILLSRVLVADKQPDVALEVLSEGVSLQPESEPLRNTYARLLVSVGKYDAALEQFRELKRLSPDDAEVLYGYAMLATQQEAWDEARGLWQTLRNEPKYYAEATYFLAQIEENAGHEQLALGLYRSVNKGPLVADAAIRAASLLQKDGQIQQAQELLQRARSDYPKRAVDLYLAEGQLLQAAKAPEEQVLRVYTRALRDHPDNIDLLYNRGLYYSEIGKYKVMEVDFRAVLDKDPHNANALNALGYMLAQQNTRLQEARAYVEQALQLKPDSAAIMDSMGWVLYRLGEFEAAGNYLRQAYAREPDVEIAAHLIEVLWVSGDRQGAQRLLQSASEKAQDNPFLSDLRNRLFSGAE